MAITKRTRYEVLRRDNHTCRYCGGTAPDVKLTVDHVTPVALGGTDRPDNLVAACKDCNAGKSSTTPDAEMVAQVGEDDMRWAAAIRRAAEEMQKQVRADALRHEWFLTAWGTWDKSFDHLPDGWEKSLDHWLGAGLTHDIMCDCLNIAMGTRAVSNNDVFAYMGGIARKRIGELHAAARALLDAEPTEGA